MQAPINSIEWLIVRRRKNHHTIMSLDAEKALKIIHYPCAENFNKLGMKRNFLNLIKGIYKKHQKNETFPPKINF